ncbi:hypothetical protein Trydic_g10188, partial [Trypoxylus dichotomus]
MGHVGLKKTLSAVRAARAYATASAEATAAISGILPADIRAKELAKRRDATKGGERIVAEIAGRNIYSRDIEQRRGGSTRAAERDRDLHRRFEERRRDRRLRGRRRNTLGAVKIRSGVRQLPGRAGSHKRGGQICEGDAGVERATLFTDSLSVLQALRGMQKPTELLLQTWKL